MVYHLLDINIKPFIMLPIEIESAHVYTPQFDALRVDSRVDYETIYFLDINIIQNIVFIVVLSCGYLVQNWRV